MIVAKVLVDGTAAKATLLQPITSGMVGAEVAIEYSAAWDGMAKTVVFSGTCVRDVITDEHVVRIPHEVLSRSGAPLMVGVYGMLGSDICIPTVWARVCSISRGCDPSGDVSTDPTLPVWAEIKHTAEEAKQQVEGYLYILRPELSAALCESWQFVQRLECQHGGQPQQQQRQQRLSFCPGLLNMSIKNAARKATMCETFASKEPKSHPERGNNLAAMHTT